MERSSFFNSVGGDRRYRAEDWARYFASFIGNGIFPVPSNALQVLAYDGMRILLRPGKAWINGYFYENSAEMAIQLNNSDGVLSRIDRIVIRWDFSERNIRVVVKSSQFASNPNPPPLQRDADVYELCLADIMIGRCITSVTQANITDTRLNEELCGIVAAVVKQIDTDAFDAQLQQWFRETVASMDRRIEESNQRKDEWFAATEAEFREWLSTTDTTFQQWFERTDIEFQKWLSSTENEFRVWFSNTDRKFRDWFISAEAEFRAWFASLKVLIEGDVALNLFNKIDNHTKERVATEKGAHGLRRYNNRLQFEKYNEWEDMSVGGDRNFNSAFTELDDIQIRSGRITNGGAGWQQFTFDFAMDGIPAVLASLVGVEGEVMITNITAAGFQYQVRIPAAVTTFTANGAASTSANTQRTIALPSVTTAAAHIIAYQAIYDGGSN